jgi:CubicO group peptidase (beta-lactamase class C family)
LIAPVDGLRLIQDETAAYFARPISEGIDQAIGGGSRFSLGMMLSCDNFPMLTAQSYGHYGVSGSLVFNDPTHQVTMAYVTNQFNGKNATDARVQNLLNALRTVLGIKG